MAVPLSVSDEAPLVLLPGTVVSDERDGSQLEIHDRVASGGMGEVYRATRLSDGARCAVKCIKRSFIGHAKTFDRARVEARVLRGTTHRHIVRVVATGVHEERIPWVAMPWLVGFTLEIVLEQRQTILLHWALEVVRDVVRGLGALHELGIVHRDVKPSNVFVAVDGVVRLLDLGAVRDLRQVDNRMTTFGFAVGTLPYMAPEQVDPDFAEVDSRTDLWASTVLLYALITGQHPFSVNGKLPGNRPLAERICAQPHNPLNVRGSTFPGWLGYIIDRGLAKHPDDRFQSADEMARALDAGVAALSAHGGLQPLQDFIGCFTRPSAPWPSPRTPGVIVAPPMTSPLPEPVRLGPQGTHLLGAGRNSALPARPTAREAESALGSNAAPRSSGPAREASSRSGRAGTEPMLSAVRLPSQVSVGLETARAGSNAGAITTPAEPVALIEAPRPTEALAIAPNRSGERAIAPGVKRLRGLGIPAAALLATAVVSSLVTLLVRNLAGGLQVAATTSSPAASATPTAVASSPTAEIRPSAPSASSATPAPAPASEPLAARPTAAELSSVPPRVAPALPVRLAQPAQPARPATTSSTPVSAPPRASSEPVLFQ